MTKKDIEKSYGICGLVCSLCSYNSNCAGCQCKEGDCEVKNCCQGKGLSYCYLCDEWPCDINIHKGIRIRAFNSIAKTEGLNKLAEYLYKNLDRGIFYHKADGLSGDYDKCKTEQEVIALLKNGKPNPFDKCPEYESKNFTLRLVSIDDVEELFLCYSDPKAQKIFNADNCTSDFKFSTIEQMNACVEDWLDAYKNKCYIRYSIIHKNTNNVIGTVEIFGGDRGGNCTEYGVLRIDVRSDYENEEALTELLKISDLFFYDFNTKMFITKAIPEALHRVNALTKNEYVPTSTVDGGRREHYYMKRSPR